MQTKRIAALAILFTGLMLVASCSKELNVLPEGSSLTNEMISESMPLSAGHTNSILKGMYRRMSQIGLDDGNHNDFGYPALMLHADHRGDWMMPGDGNYWFAPHSGWSDNSNIYMSRHWKDMYRYIFDANNLLAISEGNEALRKVAGQARALRAFAYHHIVRWIQQPYLGHEDEPGVPIVLQTTSAEEMTNNPRATVREVYKLITTELIQAIEELEGSQSSNHDEITQPVAYALLARAYMDMGMYEEALQAVTGALKTAGLNGHAAAELNEVSKPYFDMVNYKCVLWGLEILPTGVNNLVGYSGHLTPFSTSGYVRHGQAPRIAPGLYYQIPETDIRREWFLHMKDPANGDSTLYSKLLVNADGVGEEWMTKMTSGLWKTKAEKTCKPIREYSVLKFWMEDWETTTKCDMDACIVRYEELIYMKAECEAQLDMIDAAQATLNGFVQDKRDPSFDASKFTDREALVDEIYFQKRIEFFGEGVAYYDMIRLKKPMRRSETGIDPHTGKNLFIRGTRFDIEPGDPHIIIRIPRHEEQANAGIVNNPSLPRPSDTF